MKPTTKILVAGLLSSVTALAMADAIQVRMTNSSTQAQLLSCTAVPGGLCNAQQLPQVPKCSPYSGSGAFNPNQKTFCMQEDGLGLVIPAGQTQQATYQTQGQLLAVKTAPIIGADHLCELNNLKGSCDAGQGVSVTAV